MHAQNAGVIVSKVVKDANDWIHFELFELSPLNQAVMGNVGRLKRTFPGCAIAVPRNEVENPAFLQTLTDSLSKMSHQPAGMTTPTVKKAGQMHREDRDTTHPKMVTELLAAYLRSVGTMVEVSSIIKHTRQDVLWDDARSPWHRSALWLLVRVALQLFFSRQESEPAKPDFYKNYMLFLVAHTLQRAHEFNMSTDIIWSIKAKVTRRRLKIGDRGHPNVLRFVDDVLAKAADGLQRRWLQIEKDDAIHHNFADLKELPATQDTVMHLEELDKYLEAIAKREYCTQSDEFEVNCPLPDFTSPLDRSFDKFPSTTPTVFKLLKFESWVESSLDTWLMTSPKNEETCRELRSVIESYHDSAVTQYSENPEAMSNMFLVIMQLWVALDKTAISCCSLLSDYRPDLPATMLQKLILPEKGQMERLQIIEQYLEYRSSQAKLSADHIFKYFGGQNCFSVRYFNQSEKHQTMLASIEERANIAKDEKCKELAAKRIQYQYHKTQYDRSECQYVESINPRTGPLLPQHKTPCEKCNHRNAIDSLTIALYEWPLPENENQAKTVVFELRVPPSFSQWRDSTMFTLTNVLKSQYQPKFTPKRYYTPRDMEGLRGFTEYDMGRRICLASRIKPHSHTHRNVKIVVTTPIEEICVKNGAVFSYFDSTQSCFVSTLAPTDCFTYACTFRLSEASRPLQPYLDDTVPPIRFSNTAIATQFKCPQSLSLEEYKGMASLRAGSKIRWHNVLKELTSPSVDFKKEDTVLVILQCIQLAGETDNMNVLRETHAVLDDDRFSAILLSNLSDACQTISRNWQSAPALSVFISIACRVLLLSSSPHIQQCCLKLLSEARAISIGWVERLAQKAQKATEDHVRDAFVANSTFVALICADSFNISSRNMREVLSLTEQAAILIRTAIVIYEGQHKVATETNSLTALLYHRWKRLCLRSFPILVEQVIVKRNPALDQAINASWATYQPASEWLRSPEPYEHWLTSQSTLDENGQALVVQFSMLTGELLGNGVPLNRLPDEYEQSSTYKTLFGETRIEVMPSSVKGMLFSGKQTFADHELHFNLGTERNTLPETCLLIQASNQESTLELIPPPLFRNKFPATFVDECVHWYNVTEGYVEFRPRVLPWSHSTENWRLCRISKGNAWRLSKAEKSLVSIMSKTATWFSNVFQSLEDVPYVHVSLDHSTSTLEIDLPRIQLGFSAALEDTSIKSRQHRGMSVHEHQTIRTLLGLQNKLVLKSDKADSKDKVIIPNGKILYRRTSWHMLVTIDKSSSTKAQIYEIDTELGRVVDNGTLTSKLVLAYLHGLTSFCLPDPLTGSTGTNAALTILRSAAVRSFPSAGQEDIDLLAEIASLTPERKYYPKGCQNMATVHWASTLGFLAQHIEYYKSVKILFQHFQRSNVFQPEASVTFPALHRIHGILIQREKIRSAVVRSWDFGAEHDTQRHDKIYSPRDRSQNSKEALTALSLSKTVFRGDSVLQVPITSNIRDHLWKFLQKNCDSLYSGPASSLDSFRYDAAFLLESSKRIAREFLACIRAFNSQDVRLNRYQVMIWLATLAFAEDPDIMVLEVFASYFICTQMSAIEVPSIPLFYLRNGIELLENTIESLTLGFVRSFLDTPAARLERAPNETLQELRERKNRGFQEGCNRTARSIVNEMMSQWPCKTPHAPPDVDWETYIIIDELMFSLKSLFQKVHDNRHLHEYFAQIGNNIPRHSSPLDALFCTPTAPTSADYKVRGFISSDDIFSGPAPLWIARLKSDLPGIKLIEGPERYVAHLPGLLMRLDKIADSPFEANYMASLRDSLSALDVMASRHEIETSRDELCEILVRHREAWEGVVNEGYSAMKNAVTELIHTRLCIQNGTTSNFSLQHFPQICPVFFLQRLSRNRWGNLSKDWKKCIIDYGLALTQLQRAKRLLDVMKNPTALVRELQNQGHKNWNPYDYPDSLLLEIENGILIREVQEQIAAQMRDPPDGNNAVMQLNMGEGKSSVIVPIVAASLADSNRLVRVVVAKPQSKQMLQTLISKLGGLLDRQIYHLPFSRAAKIGDGASRDIERLLIECMKSGGILLTQPENILSFMLMGIESCISGNATTSQTLVKTLSFLDERSRDIVDESDENFSVKFELLYTMGLQRPIQYSPERWVCVQHVLETFRKIIPEVRRQFRSSIEICPQSNGGFPRTRIIRADAQDRIVVLIAEEICHKGLRGCPIVRQQKDFRQAVFNYITQARPSPADIRMVENNNATGFWANSRDALLLLRGLLAGGVLKFCFGHKRWRVDYGLDMGRKPETKLAVPFRAKDSPTPRSEFSHPEVVIILTQLSYYYGGLSNVELDSAFKHIMNSDQSDVEFQLWIRGTTGLSDEFKHISGINLADRSTCEDEIFPHFRFSQGAINYFLSKCVFPKEIKEFPSKLSASGWDIGKKKNRPTTGFSGTNDSRAVLPLSVEQLDLPEQKHTNALVLEYLLQPENSVALMPPHVDQEVSDAKLLLDMVVAMCPPVRVILDVGAQILELGNVGVAREWLSSIPDLEGTQAVVFFNKDDELSVLDRRGHIEPLQVSPYINQLDLCLVFLDEAHTRGTELKLPRDYRAAVTLGANLTKDRLVQGIVFLQIYYEDPANFVTACMRLRQLGHGQSVVFCVPREISSKIEQHLLNFQSTSEPNISVSDILAWAITETWNETKRSIPLWAAQGRRYQKHEGLWAQCHAEQYVLTKDLADKFLESEAQSLEDRYRPLQSEGSAYQPDDDITRRCQQFNNLKLMDAVLQEEQERELAPEVEQERQDERPPLLEAKNHKIHQDVMKFVTTGEITGQSDGYMEAFMSLQRTSAGSVFNLSEFRPGLLVSMDFVQTVKISNSAEKADFYQRPVQWVLTASLIPHGDILHMMIISPYEANELLPNIQQSQHTALHLYAPRQNLGYRSLRNLNLFTDPEALKDREIPCQLLTALNLFAGQLYIDSLDDYVGICKFLGIACEPAKDGEIIGADGFIYLDYAGRVGGESGLSASPVEFFNIFLTKIRRNCETIEKTHMGKVLDNQLLSQEDFE